jgi:hypothetical protein
MAQLRQPKTTIVDPDRGVRPALLEVVRRQAAQQAGEWWVVGREILYYDDAGQRVSVARCSDEARATYIAAVHNLFLPLSNAWLLVRRALADRAKLAQILAAEAKAGP